MTASGVAAFELVALALIVAFYLAVYWDIAAIASPHANVVGTAAFMCVLLAGAARVLQVVPAAIWGPLFWFRFATAAYFGIGAIAPYVSNGATLVYLQSMYFFTDEGVLKTNLINVICVLIVLSTVKLVEPRTALATVRESSPVQSRTLLPLAITFLLVGGAARYLFILPHTFGLIGGILPSIVAMFAKMYSAGLMLLLILGLRRGRAFLPIAVILILIDILAGVLTFAKADVLTTIIFVTLAVYQHKPSPVRLLAGGLVALAVFSALVPLIGYGRDKVAKLGGAEQSATFEQRLHIVQHYFDGESLLIETDSEVNYTLGRFCYINAEVMLVDWFDAGRPTDTLQHIFAALVPRFLWPDKPDLSQDGVELYLSVSGQTGSSISAGVFAEGYANHGWWGLPMLMIPLGLTLALLNHLATSAMRSENWLYLPVCLLCIQIGVRVDGHYSMDYVGGPATCAILFFILYAVERMLKLHPVAR